MILLNFLIAILLHNSVVVTDILQEKYFLSAILKNLKYFPSSLLEIEDVPRPLFLRVFPLFDEADRIYRQLKIFKQPNDGGIKQLDNLYELTETFTSSETKIMLDYVNLFVEKVIPYCQEYIRYMSTADGRNKKCKVIEGQSLNYVAYGAFRYISNVIKKVYSVALQTHIIHNMKSELDRSQRTFQRRMYWHPMWIGIPLPPQDELIISYKKGYETTAKKIVSVFKDLVHVASTRIALCEPTKPLIRGKTYLEMEKFLQGIFPQEITLNKLNSGKGTCSDYKYQGTAYYSYKNIKHDGDWMCHGLMYECFEVPQEMDICKPSKPNRRLDGIVHNGCDSYACTEPSQFRNLGNCDSEDKWTLFDWRYPMPFSFYKLEQCACICDDFDHPRTLRRFSREYAMSDFKNNRVVTGIRLVNISNVIHIQIQEGKLEEFGFINSSSVQWRLKNNIVNRSTFLDSRSSDEVVTLSYHKRRVNLDLFHFPPNDVVIGAAFDWTQEMDGVELTVFATTFSFSTGKLNQDYRRCIAPNGRREEIVLKTPDMPEVCDINVPVGGDDKFIKFRTTDWGKDAAQTTIPYLDIQEVVTNPPVMLRGVGLYYKNGPKCGGYIGLELYSHDYGSFILHNN